MKTDTNEDKGKIPPTTPFFFFPGKMAPFKSVEQKILF